ncbi:flavin reductase family protein [Streptomyces rubiginosohelvolus]|uniref:flavin reductase family protein n=1 Tax=Streptomyces TaxID=1883 RepID=UPI000BF00295|nr:MULTISPECIES: flavin reductase family protein [unclassified Streptomyces]MCT6778263.1 flavin reductase family protein [Streptomyces sp. CS-7]NED02483.1 flavin reductase family protein [Streptomyces sp. SID6648]
MGEVSATSRPVITIQDELRSVMRNFATGVCVVSTFTDAPSGRIHNALTVNSLTSLSLSPPLISISIRLESTFLDELMESGVWAVSVLDDGGEDLARIFARPEEERRRSLRSLPTEPGAATGAVVLDGAAWLECRYHQHVVTGDHVLVIGEVVGLGADSTRSPLVFLHGGFHRFEREQV